MKLTFAIALPSWCSTCKMITGTRREGAGWLAVKYCTKCYNPK